MGSDAITVGIFERQKTSDPICNPNNNVMFYELCFDFRSFIQHGNALVLCETPLGMI